MKKVALWIMSCFIAVLGIPMSWMIKNGLPFNVVTNAFFNSSNMTIAFYIFQWLIIFIETEIIIESYNENNIKNLKWTSVLLAITFICTDFYLYYLALAIYSYIALLVVSHKRNQYKDEITQILEDVREEYSHQ